MTESVIVTREDGGVAVVTLSRPTRLNALTGAMIEELLGAFDDIERDTDVRAVVLTGEGRGFCSGLDLGASLIPPGTEELGPVQQQLVGQRRWWAQLVPRIRTLPQPVIAAVNGPAVGGGFVLALAADVRIASTSARFADGFLKMGVSGCELGLGWLLPRVVGAGRAAHMLLTAAMIEADEARDVGLVSAVVSDAEVVDAAVDLGRGMASNSPLGLALTKELMWASLQVPFDVAVRMEGTAQVLALQTEDSREQLRARRAGDSPKYRMR